MCRQEGYLQNSVDWKLVKGDMKSFNWSEIIKYPRLVSSLNEVLLLVKSNISFPNGRLWSEREISIGLNTGVSWLTA